MIYESFVIKGRRRCRRGRGNPDRKLPEENTKSPLDELLQVDEVGPVVFDEPLRHDPGKKVDSRTSEIREGDPHPTSLLKRDGGRDPGTRKTEL